MDATMFLNGKPWHVDGDVIQKFSPNLAMSIHCNQNAVHVHLDNPVELKRLGEEIIKLAFQLQDGLYLNSLQAPPLVHSSRATAPALAEIDEAS